MTENNHEHSSVLLVCVCFISGLSVAKSRPSRLSVVSAVSLLKDLKHANIVTLHDIVHTDKSLMLVFEYLVRLNYVKIKVASLHR